MSPRIEWGLSFPSSSLCRSISWCTPLGARIVVLVESWVPARCAGSPACCFSVGLVRWRGRTPARPAAVCALIGFWRPRTAWAAGFLVHRCLGWCEAADSLDARRSEVYFQLRFFWVFVFFLCFGGMVRRSYGNICDTRRLSDAQSASSYLVSARCGVE